MGSFTSSGQVETSGSGTITALNGAVTLNIPTSSSAGFQVTGTWVATLTFEASVDGTNWFTVVASTVPSGSQVSTTTANGAFLAGVGGYQGFRVRASAFTSGTATVSWTADNTPNISSTVQQGNPPWSQNITQVGGSSVSLGQTTMANSVPVAIASNQTAIPVTDNSGSLTVDGTVAVSNLPATADTNYGTPGSSTVRTASMLGVGSTAVSNSNPVPISDAGGSVTVDGTVTANQGGAPWQEKIVGGTDSTIIGNVSDRLKVDANFSTSQSISAVPDYGTKVTYSAATISFNLATLATDFFTITGSATKTVRVTEISVAFTGGGVVVAVQLVKRSTANSGGTSTLLTNVPHDSNNAAATATVRSYTANPTLGTLVGVMRADKTDSPLTTSTTNPEGVFYKFFGGPQQPIVLRGTSQVLAFNLNGVTLSGGTAVCYVEWTEE